MKKRDLNSNPWADKTVAQTVEMYREWAAHYDEDLIGSGYLSPARCATAMRSVLAPEDPILDFGCGTGLSGTALSNAGFTTFDGCDVTAEMLEIAKQKSIYRRLWLAQPETIDLGSAAYRGVIAAGVISRGAAPADTLAALLHAMPTDCYLAFSYNDPTIADPAYQKALKIVQDQNLAMLISSEYGPHIPSKDMGSDVILLQRI